MFLLVTAFSTKVDKPGLISLEVSFLLSILCEYRQHISKRYADIQNSRSSQKSAVYIYNTRENRSGPRILPCGTPG